LMIPDFDLLKEGDRYQAPFVSPAQYAPANVLGFQTHNPPFSGITHRCDWLTSHLCDVASISG
jgi:hypothetical protein